jgi:hypothetical protein
MKQLLNPWVTLAAEPPFVLESDQEGVAAFNARIQPEQRLHTELLPEPFVGNLKSARELLLNMNPAYDPKELAFHRDPNFVSVARANLKQRALEYPFYFLDPSGRSPGHIYWSQHLRALTEACGGPLSVARKVAVVEWCPYHSLGMSRTGAPLQVPSQAFSFDIVERALRRGTVVIMIRAVEWWKAKLFTLPDHKVYVFPSKNRQGGYLSRSTCPDGFDAAVNAIAKEAS